MHVTWLSVKWQCETQVLRDQRAARHRAEKQEGRWQETWRVQCRRTEERNRDGERGWRRREKNTYVREGLKQCREWQRKHEGVGGWDERNRVMFSSVGHWQPSIQWVFNIEMPCFFYSRLLEIMTTIGTYGKSQSFSPFTLSTLGSLSIAMEMMLRWVTSTSPSS